MHVQIRGVGEVARDERHAMRPSGSGQHRVNDGAGAVGAHSSPDVGDVGVDGQDAPIERSRNARSERAERLRAQIEAESGSADFIGEILARAGGE